VSSRSRRLDELRLQATHTDLNHIFGKIRTKNTFTCTSNTNYTKKRISDKNTKYLK